jgi:hypothetical protein
VRRLTTGGESPIRWSHSLQLLKVRSRQLAPSTGAKRRSMTFPRSRSDADQAQSHEALLMNVRNDPDRDTF